MCVDANSINRWFPFRLTVPFRPFRMHEIESKINVRLLRADHRWKFDFGVLRVIGFGVRRCPCHFINSLLPCTTASALFSLFAVSDDTQRINLFCYVTKSSMLWILCKQYNAKSMFSCAVPHEHILLTQNTNNAFNALGRCAGEWLCTLNDITYRRECLYICRRRFNQQSESRCCCCVHDRRTVSSRLSTRCDVRNRTNCPAKANIKNSIQ